MTSPPDSVVHWDYTLVEGTSDVVTLGQRCPSCRGSRVYQSRRRLFDIPFRLLFMKAVRCGECDQRFYRPRWIATPVRERRQPRVVPIKRASA
jgi:hypothetical protein